MSAVRYADIFGLHIEIEAVVTTVSTDAAMLHTSKGGREMAIILGIDPDHAGVYFLA